MRRQPLDPFGHVEPVVGRHAGDDRLAERDFGRAAVCAVIFHRVETCIFRPLFGTVDEEVDEGIAPQVAVAAPSGTLFVVGPHHVGMAAAPPDREGDRRGGVGAQQAGRRVVGKDGQRDGTLPCGDRFEDRPHHPCVERFDRPYFQFGVSFVARLVARFDMQEDEILVAQRPQRGLGLAFVVGVVEPRRSFDFDGVSPAQTPIPRIRSTAEMTEPLRIGA